MGSLVAAMATAHAFALMDPTRWDEFRERNRQGYQRRYGVMPPVNAQLAKETLDSNLERYRSVREAHDRLDRELREVRPDVLFLVGDDQNELYHADNIPQIAIYNGGDFVTRADESPYTSHPEVANLLLRRLVRDGYDVSICSQFADDRLKSHAFAELLDRLASARSIPIVPIFVNGIHVPAPEPYRCHALGGSLRKIIAADLPAGTRVAVLASGGLSHFTAGYPWPAYHGPFQYGDISVDFDRSLIEAMTRGEGEKLAELTADDLLDHGEIEFRSWLVVLGMVGKTPIEMLAYEPFYSAIMGIGVGRWEVQ
ncbi:MAG TPA: extradiol ring-cleavage dioxygenase [Candidatus Binatia bacterium]|nr:extradiol ring-cleavage dioxygenase [Candidatus Binatia bacterium]